MTTLSDKHLEPEWIAAGLEVKKILVDHLLSEDMKYRDFHRQNHPTAK